MKKMSKFNGIRLFVCLFICLVVGCRLLFFFVLRVGSDSGLTWFVVIPYDDGGDWGNAKLFVFGQDAVQLVVWGLGCKISLFRFVLYVFMNICS